MKPAKKITVEIAPGLIKKAVAATGLGLTSTIRKGLELVAAGPAYDKLRALRGKVKFSIKLQDMRSDRS